MVLSVMVVSWLGVVLPGLLALPLLLATAAMSAIGRRRSPWEGVVPRHCRGSAVADWGLHRSAPLLPSLLALPAIALLLAIEAQRASQLRMRTSAYSIQTMTGLRTFNPKVVGSSPTGGTGQKPPSRRIPAPPPPH